MLCRRGEISIWQQLLDAFWHELAYALINDPVNVTFDSSPDAVDALPENGPIQYDGSSQNGFAKYKLTLPTAE
ncbi:hypothetical protein [Bacillus sp. m3-13]|uniref:hypothetical protein n=1 Tax=Bacillus sp. m3-13 TaxID=406124 RepID=UPI0003107C53|nr:hypothetical protein [Bacillus sp. m3-13]